MLVGYDDNVGPNGCWIIKNSWSSGWGMNGYAYVEYGDLEKYNYAWVVMDTSGPDTQPDTQTIVMLDDTVEDVGWSQSYWTESGLWHVTEKRSNSGTHSWWYGQESTGDYDTTGSANSGCLVSEVIDLAGALDATLNFWTYWVTETTGRDYDKKLVEISTDGGTTWSVLEQLYSGMQGDISVSLEDYVGEGVMIRFCFDTVDELYNDYEGWFVDDVRVEKEEVRYKATLTSPSGVTTTSTPTYEWNEVPESTWYYLWVNAASGDIVKEWYEAEDVCSGGTCTITPSIALSSGDYTWKIQTYICGNGPWSDPMTFNVEIS